MKAHILSVGDELLIGQVINTNQAHIASRLNALGIDVVRMSTVADSAGAIRDALGAAWSGSDLTLVTGGLGPTHDDVTRKALCDFFTTELVPDEEVRRHIREILQKRNMPWTAAAEDQSLVPRGALVLPNPLGTAPGLLFHREGKRMVVLPGVPDEMKEILERSVLPAIAPGEGESVIRHRTLLTTGIPESFLAAQLGDLDRLLGGASLAFLPSPYGVRLRITARDVPAARADETVREAEQRIRARISRYVYGTDDEDLEGVVGRLLAAAGRTLAVAESCTGGLIAHRLTNVSGSSAYFERGIVTYSDASKSALLGVPEELLRAHGAVSGEVAEAMASGVRRLAGTDLGLSTTGIAGPTGGTPSTPVGTVWTGIADAAGARAALSTFGGSRLRIKERASQAALETLRRKLLGLA